MNIKFVDQPIFLTFGFSPQVINDNHHELSLEQHAHTVTEIRVAESEGGIIGWLKSLPENCTCYIYNISTEMISICEGASPTIRYAIYHTIRAYIDETPEVTINNPQHINNPISVINPLSHHADLTRDEANIVRRYDIGVDLNREPIAESKCFHNVGLKKLNSKSKS